jgi:hypothetical protein
MTDVERFKAVCRGERPDYVPIFAFPGAPGMSDGLYIPSHERLVEQGMPEWVDGAHSLNQRDHVEGWYRYWGTTGPIFPEVEIVQPAKGLKSQMRIEGDREIIECESGALTSQVIDNDITYSMPEFITYPVRDRKSWEFYRDRMTPAGMRPNADQLLEAERIRLADRTRPLCAIGCITWGLLRSLMGPEKACTVLYDDPQLAHEILEWHHWIVKTYHFPLIEKLRPEIIACGEDCCYNHGMLISPRHFREFCCATYRSIGQIARDCNVDMVTIDTDGNYMEMVPIVEECGVNAIFPSEVKAGNDLFAIRQQHAEFILMGWLEKEVVNEGNEHLIEAEIMSKVPPLLEKGRYFPNGDHGIQPLVTFDGMCKFMTLLHEVTGNPEGEFPRMRP